jgi:hypothetical protein
MTNAVKLTNLKFPSASSPRETESPVGELDRLDRSLAEVTPENHPRTARLLASRTGTIAPKVIEEAGGHRPMDGAVNSVAHSSHCAAIQRQLRLPGCSCE